MQELEKILEEIDRQKSECLSGEYEPAYAAGALDMANAIKDIIRKHMNDGWIPVEDERLWNILFEEACVEGEQAMRLIDADKLYDWVRRECNPYGKPTIDFESGNRMLDMIKRSSTAFDKEKVIEELED